MKTVRNNATRPCKLLRTRERDFACALLAILCVGIAGIDVAFAQNVSPPPPAQQDEGPLHFLFRQGGFATTPPPAKDFVRETSPNEADTQFIPAGRTPPPRATKPRDAKGLKALEAELDAVRMRHDRISGRVVNDKPVAKAGKSKKATKTDSGEKKPPALDNETN